VHLPIMLSERVGAGVEPT